MYDNIRDAFANLYMFEVSGNLSVGDDKTLWRPVWNGGRIISAFAICKTAPTGADLTMEVEKWTGAAWSTAIANTVLVISAGNNDGDTSTIVSPSLSVSNRLRLNIDQIGSGAAGADLCVIVVVALP